MYGAGELVEVVGNEAWHGFYIGEPVIIIDAFNNNPNSDLLCYSMINGDKWCVCYEDVRKVVWE